MLELGTNNENFGNSDRLSLPTHPRTLMYHDARAHVEQKKAHQSELRGEKGAFADDRVNDFYGLFSFADDQISCRGQVVGG